MFLPKQTGPDVNDVTLVLDPWQLLVIGLILLFVFIKPKEEKK